MELQELRRLQRNARNKESRLRGRGADWREVRASSPRKDWADVAKMDERGRERYAEQLRRFNDRREAFHVLESGELVSADAVREMKALITERNRQVIETQKTIKRYGDIDRLRDERRFLFGDQRRDNVLGMLTQIENAELPRTKRGLQMRLRNLQNAVNTPWEKRSAQMRRNMVHQLESLGEMRLANVVRNMPRAQFDGMATFSGIWDILAVYYVPKEKDGQPKAQAFDSGRSRELRETVYNWKAAQKKLDQADRYVRRAMRAYDEANELLTKEAIKKRNAKLTR